MLFQPQVSQPTYKGLFNILLMYVEVEVFSVTASLVTGLSSGKPQPELYIRQGPLTDTQCRSSYVGV